MQIHTTQLPSQPHYPTRHYLECNALLFPPHQYPGHREQFSQHQDERPPTYTVLALISCLIFFPVGIIAVLMSKEAVNRLQRGDFKGSRKAGNVSKQLAISVIVFAILIGVTVGTVYVVKVAPRFMNSNKREWRNWEFPDKPDKTDEFDWGTEA